MSETSTATAAAETKTPGKIVSVGTVQKMDVTVPRGTNNEENINAGGEVDNKEGNAGDQNNGQQNQQQGADAGKQSSAPPAEQTAPTDEQLKAYFEKLGIPFEGTDKLKEKLTATTTPAPLTDEQKKEQEAQKEKRLIDLHIANKRPVEEYVALKNLLAVDKVELGLQKEIDDLIAFGFSKEKADEMARAKYDQLTDEQIEAIEDEDLKKEAKKAKEFGLKKLENKGKYLQNSAKSYLDILETQIKEQDAEKVKMEQHSSKVEDAIKNYQRKEQLKLGELDGVEIPSIEFEYSDTALNAAKDILHDAVKFEENLFTNDGDLNIGFILPHLVRSLSMDEAIKKSYLEAQNRTIETIKSKFGSTPPPLGGNKPKTGTPGKITGFGEKQVFRPVAAK